MDIDRHEIYNIELEERDIQVRYYPSQHRIEVESSQLHPRNDLDNDQILKDRLGLDYEADSYGEPAYKFIEVFLDDNSGLMIEDEDQNLQQLLEPRKPE